MGRGIVKLTDDEKNDWFLEWSTVVDAPVTYGMTLKDFTEHYIEEFGETGERELAPRLERVARNGHSFLGDHHGDVINVIGGNRAGQNGTELTYRQLVAAYCVGDDRGKMSIRPVGHDHDDACENVCRFKVDDRASTRSQTENASGHTVR